jgi:hypothetical protein
VNQDKTTYLANRIREKWELPRHKSGITGASTADGTRLALGSMARSFRSGPAEPEADACVAVVAAISRTRGTAVAWSRHPRRSEADKKYTLQRYLNISRGHPPSAGLHEHAATCLGYGAAPSA